MADVWCSNFTVCRKFRSAGYRTDSAAVPRLPPCCRPKTPNRAGWIDSLVSHRPTGAIQIPMTLRATKKLAFANAGVEPSSTAASHTIAEPNRSSTNDTTPINLDWLRTAVVITFLAGFAWSLLHLVLGAVRLRALRRNSTPAAPEIVALLCDHKSARARPMTLLVSSEIDVPVTFGILRPVVMLPAAMIHSGGWWCCAIAWLTSGRTFAITISPSGGPSRVCNRCFGINRCTGCCGANCGSARMNWPIISRWAKRPMPFRMLKCCWNLPKPASARKPAWH